METSVKFAVSLLGIILVLIEMAQARRKSHLARIAHWSLSAVAGVSILVCGFLWLQHIAFPLNLDLMEGTILQHFRRAVEFQPIYPAPTSDYVPLAYNPLYYVLSIPFAWVFGVNLSTLRFVSILGALGSGLIVYRVVRGQTTSRWWGLMSIGLFAAAYSAMDAYLDTAHSDAWLLCASLTGSYLIGLNRSRWWNLTGIVTLVAAFWFKQHGALFALGGLLFLTWREGIRRSLLYWITVVALGPILYIFAGDWLFGSHFHYFTWQVPRQWSEFNLDNFKRYFGFIQRSYPVLALSSIAVFSWGLAKHRNQLEIWHFQFVAAALAGFMGTLDHGSSNNVFIPMGTLFILMGVLGLHALSQESRLAQRYRIYLLALFISFAAFVYNPQHVLISPFANASYSDFISTLRHLDGNVYAPSLGQLQRDYSFYPAANWVALEDMVRGPGRTIENQPIVRQLLNDVIHPSRPTFILSNYLVEQVTPAIAFLNDYYTLETDFGDRFEPLRCLIKRFDHGYPRYLYRYTAARAVDHP